MVTNVCSVELPIGEKLVIKKNRMSCENAGKGTKRIAIVSGIHGDELEGQYVCYETIRRIREHPEYLKGIVDVYPQLNPLGIDVARRNIPKLEMDMNCLFPGSEKGAMMEKVLSCVVSDIAGADICIDVHASDMFVREIPQVRIGGEFTQKLLPYAKMLNADLIWLNATATVQESTLAHSTNMMGVPTLVVEMGLGMRINKEFDNQIVDGIFNLMHEIGIWTGPVNLVREPAISTDGRLELVRAGYAGIFVPSVAHKHYVQEDELIGELIDSLTGTVKQRIVAKKPGLVFTLREYPFVYKGALLARILQET